MKRILLSLSLLSIICSLLLFTSCDLHKHNYSEWNNSENSCTVDGVNYRICMSCGNVEYSDVQKAPGHTLGDWEDNIQTRTRYSKCSTCGLTFEIGEYEAPENFPIINFYGKPDGVTVQIDIAYQFNEKTLNLVGETRLDSNRDNTIYKKDYDLFIFTDKETKTPQSVKLDEKIGDYSSFTLKAEYADRSAIRNLALSDIWKSIVAARANLDSNLKKTPNLGAEQGVPCLFYTNDNYKGIYNLCTPNDKDLFGLTDEENQALIYTYTDFKIFDFRYTNGLYGDKIPCTVIFPETEDKKSNAENSFLEFINFVNNSTDEQFRKDASKHLDVNAAVDYLICLYVFGADENIAEYCNWVTYDGKKWIPSLYNLTASLGINHNGNEISPEETFAPYYDENGQLFSGILL